MVVAIANKWKNPNRYIPVDELLAMPRVRILRLLRHFDWASTDDVRVGLDLGDELAMNAHTRVLTRLVVEGHVEKRCGTRRLRHRRSPIATHRFRITEQGKRHLAELLGRGIVDEVSR